MGLPEAEAIPFEAQDLRGERLLVLAPHPDDEVIGCGGLVALHLRERRSVRVLVATDGGAAGAAALRESESAAALASLGEAQLEFLRFPDRQLASNAAALQERLEAVLRDYRPDLIALPSAIEIHPDHVALATAFCELIARDPSLFADLAVTRVAFYEVSHPLRPNALVDISDVSEAKYAAIAAHQSQLAFRDYVKYARGLNAYRGLTLPPTVAYAEAYYVVALPQLRTMPLSALRSAMAAPPVAAVVRETVPVTVIVRTKDRPALLREAVASVRATGYPASIVVVNDGGAKAEIENVRTIDHPESRGRSEAANSGVRAASTPFVAFLDDDDLYYPEHLATLATATSEANGRICYSDAVSAFLRLGPSGSFETHSRLRLFAQDFDRDLLLIDNYIPLPTLLLPREAILAAGGFDPAFDLFEDWDLLLRLAQRTDFVRVPRITCEIRHIEGGGSITLAAREGSDKFRTAKLAIWNKHRALLTDDVIANAFERQKRRVLALESDAAEAKGGRALTERERNAAAREHASLANDYAALARETQSMHERLNGALMSVREFEGAAGELRNALGRAEHERNELLVRAGELGDARAALDEAQRTITALYAEIARQQNILDTIFRSRTWKLHTMVERLKGRR